MGRGPPGSRFPAATCRAGQVGAEVPGHASPYRLGDCPVAPELSVCHFVQGLSQVREQVDGALHADRKTKKTRVDCKR